MLEDNKELGSAQLRSEWARAFVDFQKEVADWSQDDKGKPWTDDELRVVLVDAPTRENAIKHARAFNRGVGAVEQIYRWALTPIGVIDRKRAEHKFVQQVRTVSKDLGWLS